jgi:preprotein translocase subunit SecA
MLNFISKLFDYNEKQLKRLGVLVEEINKYEEEIESLSDSELKSRTKRFKEQIKKGTDPKDLIPEAFAVVREAAVRTVGLRPYDVQMIAAISLWEGKIAEQKTGEGKTLSATPALYLRALEGKGAHLVTVNDYLARRDCGWMAPIFDLLGLSVGCIIPDQSFIYDADFSKSADDERLVHLKPTERKEVYQADITYGTNNEFGFDYLRDNMAQSLDDVVQREHYFAIVDEIDFALIDEARTPLIISSPEQKPTEKYYQYASLAQELFPETDYIVDEKARSAMLTEYGIRKVERKLSVNNLYEEDFETIHQIENALKARTLFKKDKDYVVKDDQVIIVDEFTGRLMEGRRWSDGLHQAVEAKEGVPIQKESKTWATITFQNYFRKYNVLSGMTGTAETEKEEFKNIYGLEVLVIPTNEPVIREDYPDQIYKTKRAKFTAVAAEVAKCYQRGQPVLVGTTSIEKNEMVSNYLKKKNIPHEILNAKHHQKEAKIISQAGKPKAVTVATNMAGRGVDIVLGGEPPKEIQNLKSEIRNKDPKYKKWQEERSKVLEFGGLYVIGTERHEARRIDNQLRGRSGRQGDPGASKFFVSLQDDLMRVFGGERISNMMERLQMPEDAPISHPMVTKMIKQIQVKVEGFNFDMRKSLVEFDDIVNKQREIIYSRRREILKDFQNQPEQLKRKIMDIAHQEIKNLWNMSLDPESMKPDYKKLIIGFNEIIPIENKDERENIENKIKKMNEKKAINFLKKTFDKYYQQREEVLGPDASRQIEKSVLLYTLDNLWVDHLTALDNLQEGVRLRGYGQRDPLVEYRKESYQMFQDLLAKVDHHVSRRIMRVDVGIKPTLTGRVKEGRGKFVSPESQGSQPVEQKGKKIEPITSNQPSPGRNDPCPCGSGEKYKKCCYPKYE